MISCSQKSELIMDCSGVVGHPCTIVFTPWDEGIQWSGESDGEIEGYGHLENPGISLSLIASEPASLPWTERIPAGLRPQLLAFETICPDLIFPAMWFLSRYSSAIDLLRSCPLLLALILLRAKKEDWEERTIVGLFSAKRTQILAACSLHGTKANLKLLKNLVFKQFGPKEFRMLQESQDLPECSLLGHLQYLDFALLRFLKLSPAFASSRLFRKYAAAWPWDQFQRLHADIVRMAEVLRLQGIEDKIASCRTIKELSNLHDRLVVRINTLKADSLPATPYPPPPIAGTDQIIPITDSKQLTLEGQLLHHCVAGFSQAITERNYYVYRVTAPERATLGIKIMANNEFKLDQVKLRYNAQPSKATLAVVNDWMVQARYHRLGSVKF